MRGPAHTVRSERAEDERQRCSLRRDHRRSRAGRHIEPTDRSMPPVAITIRHATATTPTSWPVSTGACCRCQECWRSAIVPRSAAGSPPRCSAASCRWGCGARHAALRPWLGIDRGAARRVGSASSGGPMGHGLGGLLGLGRGARASSSSSAASVLGGRAGRGRGPRPRSPSCDTSRTAFMWPSAGRRRGRTGRPARPARTTPASTPAPGRPACVDHPVDLGLGLDVDCPGGLVEQQHRQWAQQPPGQHAFCWLPTTAR